MRLFSKSFQTRYAPLARRYTCQTEYLSLSPQSSAQIAYIQHVLSSDNANRHSVVAALFNRFLKTSPFVDLWKFYLAHVRCVVAYNIFHSQQIDLWFRRKMHPDPSSRDTVRKAYEYALNHIGHDKDSNEIWTDYIQFLKSGEVRVHAHLDA